MEIDLTELTGWNDAVQKAPKQLDVQMVISTDVALMAGTTEAKELAPFQDGDLRGDIRIMERAHRGGGGYEGSYGTDLEYAAQREYGGTIEPRNGDFLVWEGEDGELIYARSVYQEGSFYMERSVEALEPKLPRIYEAGIEKAMRGVGS